MNGNSLQFSTIISTRDRGDFLVERVCHGVVVDKYTTTDLKVRRRSAPWASWIHIAANTPLGSTLTWESLSDDMMCELESVYVEDLYPDVHPNVPVFVGRPLLCWVCDEMYACTVHEGHPICDDCMEHFLGKTAHQV